MTIVCCRLDLGVPASHLRPVHEGPASLWKIFHTGRSLSSSREKMSLSVFLLDFESMNFIRRPWVAFEQLASKSCFFVCFFLDLSAAGTSGKQRQHDGGAEPVRGAAGEALVSSGLLQRGGVCALLSRAVSFSCCPRLRLSHCRTSRQLVGEEAQPGAPPRKQD